jgi:hypothetical protein
VCVCVCVCVQVRTVCVWGPGQCEDTLGTEV